MQENRKQEVKELYNIIKNSNKLENIIKINNLENAKIIER